MAAETASRLTQAARACLLAEGYANLSTRRVADHAGVPLSQIHYHFGGKQGLVLALLAAENEKLVARQDAMYAGDTPLSARYDQACDFLDDDLASGYVRVLQEMIAAGWSDSAVAEQIIALLRAWIDVLRRVLSEAERDLGGLGPFSAEDVALLVGMAFLGGESVLLLGDDHWSTAVRRALRRVGDLIRLAERS
ncbi:TetR/AcrR family transcriptional regulator [Nocardioides sp. CER19]|uniref:TetR/AcrR family transcriptional regulator n=1 Tax=Nocardioides sp. CER19 TaxID=3038538 RepID=UPI00244BB6EE|nr:TetR/AcrR family transcriptional regulator [Nocardioides sp. CER19]MDH2415093.1 TetR/AcrR family transcriptional regulator [Nocardioides sp. CER19]